MRPVKGQEDPEREHEVGTFVRQRRLSAGLTQQQLGELAGVGKRLGVEDAPRAGAGEGDGDAGRR